MSRYIGQYMGTCDLCLQMKPWQHSPVGELQPLSVLDARWNTLSVDFVVELLESSRHDTVMMVVDAVCKGITLEVCLVTWVGSHLRADILPSAFSLSPVFSSVTYCVIPVKLLLDLV